MATQYKCTCGSPRPYRRAYGCKKCWERANKMALIEKRATRNNGSGSLSLRGVRV